MSSSEAYSGTSPIDESLVDTNAGEVPPDRPHFAFWPRRLARTVTPPETSLWHNVEVASTRYPAKAATLFFGRAKSYATLRAEAEAIAGWLQAQGVKRGDRVALFMQNCPQYLVAYHAILRADAVVVPVNAMNKVEEFGHYIVDPGTRVVICGAELAGIVAGANAALPPSQRAARVLAARYADELPDAFEDGLEPPAAMRDWLLADPPLPPGTVRWRDALAEGHAPGPAVAGPDDLALLPYTSGTTGLPKGCMHTHRTLMANVVGGAEWGSGSAESVVLGVVPMFHITGMLYGVISPMFGGATVVVMPRWDRELAGRLISRHKVSHWTCIPTMVIDLFGSPNYRSFDLSSLRWLSGGGAAMPQAVAQRLIDEFGLRFCEGYGLTETAAPSHANPAERPKLQCLGMPFFGVDSRVVDPLTLKELPPGEVGEIVTRGPMVFRGYWKNPEATAAAFVEVEGRRYFRTGDLGHMDEDGYFFITDRLKRMINASGFKVWPSEVELLLYKHPAVQEACVISAQDAYRGETVKAIVVLRAEARGKVQERDIVAWAHENMAAYKAPRVVEFVDALPKSGAGKVMWRLLQDQENAGRNAG
ncbi:MAG TPA: long-chain fatty acid--CoA ligase [Burkholderiaceae bacterium]|jgi:fatty-acyl-CoA synthase|nr:long-chain fatty acid--CoA ligase [Burkholderiaceae bacterium]